MTTTPVILPGKFHGLRNLVGYSPWGCKALDTTEQTHTHTHTHTHTFNTLTQEWQYFQTYLCWVLSWGALGLIAAFLFTCNIRYLRLCFVHMTLPRWQSWAKNSGVPTSSSNLYTLFYAASNSHKELYLCIYSGKARCYLLEFKRWDEK